MLTRKKRLFSAFVLFLFCILSFLPTASFATEDKEAEASSNNSGSQLIEITANYLNGIGGTEIINSETYSTARSEKEPQYIEDYVYVDYEENVDYIYVPKDIPYIVGYPDDTVRPLRYLTRAEAAAIFSRLYDGDYPKQVNTYHEGKTFTDVSENHWAHDEIVKLYECGIISGDNHMYYPDTPITRAELAALATRFNPDKFPSNDAGSSPFKDVADGKWYDDVVALAAANKWVSGYPDGSFRPEANVTRTETMAVINRVLQRQITTERLNEVGAPNPYTDIKASDWYYADAIEATIPHNTEDWHVIDYNDGQYNVIVENFVDREGNTLAEEEVSAGKEMDAPKDIPGFEYLGYIRHTTYIYEPGVADPEIIKVSDAKESKPFQPGDTVTYTVAMNNSADATRKIENATFKDTIPEYLTLVDGSVTLNNKSVEYELTYDKDEETGEDINETINVTIGDIPIGETQTVKFKCTIKEDAWNQTIKNTAIMSGDNIEDQEAMDEGYTVREGIAILNIEKTGSRTKVEVGDKYTYNVKVSVDKESETKAKNVVVTDVIDENLNFDGNVLLDNQAVQNYTYDQETRTLTVELGTMEKETSKVLSLDVSVLNEAYNAKIENTAEATADNADPVEDAADVVQVVDGLVDMTIEKNASVEEAVAGQTFTYTIDVGMYRYSETDARNVVVTDVIDENLNFVGPVYLGDEVFQDYKYNRDSRTLTINLGDMNVDEVKNLSFDVSVKEDVYNVDVPNVATVEAENSEPVSDDAQVHVRDGVAKLILDKSVDKTDVEVGDEITYTIKVEVDKLSETKARNVLVTDVVDSNLHFNDVVKIDGRTTNDYIFDSETRTLTVELGDMDKGEIKEISFKADIVKTAWGANIANVATDTAENADPVEDDADIVIVNRGEARLSIAKDVNTLNAEVGDSLTYTMNVTADLSSKEPARNVIVTDVIDENLEFDKGVMVDGKSADYSYDKDTRTLTIELGDMDPGTSKVVSFDVRVAKGAYNTIIENTGYAEADNAPMVSDSAEVVTVAEGGADLTIKKSVDQKEVYVGDTVFYTIKVQNERDADTTAHNVVVEDKLPEGMQFAGIALLNGQNANYKYDPDTNVVSVIVGGLNPGEEAEVKVQVLITEAAYSMELKNVAVVTSDNADPKEDETTINVPDGDPNGNISRKTPSKTSVKPDEQFTYTITIGNDQNATADWENVVIEDPLPNGIVFEGNVEVDGTGQSGTNHQFDDRTNTITFRPDPIAPGEKVTYRFTVHVAETIEVDGKVVSTEGMSFTNIATLTDDEGETPIPSVPVEVPIGDAAPSITKTADVETAEDLDFVTYTVTLRNDANASIWKNVVLEDVLPAETQLVGQPTVNGVGNSDYVKGGNTITIVLGDIQPNQTVEVKYTVMVRQGTQKTLIVTDGQKATEEQIRDLTVTLRNVATASGDNGTVGATDDKVKVPPIVVEEGGGDNPPAFNPGEPTIEKLTEKTIVDLGNDPYNEYTILLTNPSDEVWKDVVVTDDYLDTSRLHLVSDSVTVNGVNKPWGSGYTYTANKTTLRDKLSIPVGDIEPGKTVTVKFEVRFENDGASDPYTNRVTATSSSHDPVNDSATVSTFNNIQPITGEHVKLFAGYTDGTWWPNDESDNGVEKFLSLEEAACVVGRSVTAEQRDALLGGKDYAEAYKSLPDTFPKGNEWYSNPVCFMGAIGCLTEDDVAYESQFNTQGTDYYIVGRMIATREQLSRMIHAVGLGEQLKNAPGNWVSTDPSVRTARLSFANDICKILSRDSDPNFNGCQTPTFSDTSASVVSEVSIYHNYVLEGHNNNEIWTFSDASRGVEF